MQEMEWQISAMEGVTCLVTLAAVDWRESSRAVRTSGVCVGTCERIPDFFVELALGIGGGPCIRA